MTVARPHRAAPEAMRSIRQPGPPLQVKARGQKTEAGLRLLPQGLLSKWSLPKKNPKPAAFR